MKDLPRIVVTMGDPAGIGPEVIVKALGDTAVRCQACFLVVGNATVFAHALETVNAPLELVRVSGFEDPAFSADALNLLDAVDLDWRRLPLGAPSAEGGRAAAQAIEIAARLTLNGAADAVVTAPISKQALHMAGIPFAGHTEFLAALCGVQETRLMLVCDALRVVHATGHMALRDAIATLTPERIVRTVELSVPVLQRLGIERPSIAVAALNPHAGEGGMFGDEDERTVRPAVERLRTQGWEAVGPIPADSVFWRARKGEFDVVVALYHDQGHIAVKVLAFDRAVNVTVGLPILRTSPDHGVAFDIAWQNKARATSFQAALALAVQMAQRGEGRSAALPLPRGCCMAE
ncbi:4-hydroxythreonine-4-phosphate dehydrogenase 2 [bacterium HR17]|uniref:4-hydroxythreonine-4-phosphate dehydrogenase 2 n=1 Tax=Candidatus Fervidibacter japonicus TaxID=2035412 RepID=A0A2H5XG21_9BACT|nr:4-hydroxythreonine-4-phosphate dehydrogenase 2 [bacterium HR17]